jgi:hypothetical protein
MGLRLKTLPWMARSGTSGTTYLRILLPVAEKALATTPATELKISFYLRVCKKAPCS